MRPLKCYNLPGIAKFYPYGQISLCLNQYNSMAQHTQNLNNAATRAVQGGFNAMFSGNIFSGNFKKIPSSCQYAICWSL